METSYLKCQKLEKKIKEHAEILKTLRKELKEEKEKFYAAMTAKDADVYKGITKASLRPTPKRSAKQAREEKEEKIKMILSSSGVPEPSRVFEQIKGVGKRAPKKKKDDS